MTVRTGKDRAAIFKTIIEFLKPIGVRRISVFGSFARNDDSSGSDIDILVDLKSTEDRPVLGFKWFTLEEELSSLLGKSVDLVSEKSLSERFRQKIRNDIQVIYEETG